MLGLRVMCKGGGVPVIVYSLIRQPGTGHPLRHPAAQKTPQTRLLLPLQARSVRPFEQLRILYLVRYVARLAWASCLSACVAKALFLPKVGSPHTRGDALLLLAHGVGIDRRSGEGRPSHFCTMLSAMPRLTACTPKPCRRPLGQAWGPAGTFAARITSCTRRKAVMRLQGQSSAFAWPRRCASRRACRKFLALTARQAWRSTLPSGSGGPHDPECDCREAKAPIQGRL